MEICIDGRNIGPSHKPYIIAECADAHMGSMDYAKALVRMAATCGADAVKFQHHLPDEEMLPDSGPLSDNLPEEGLYQWLKTHALTLDQHRELKQFCVQEGITYLCTPFSWKAAQEINDLVPAFKIGSGEAQDFPTLGLIASLDKPMIVSTGMCTEKEVVSLVEFLPRSTIFMHCVSEYPPHTQDLNVYWLKELECYCDIYGYSSHYPLIHDSVMAMGLGASVIEKHVTLSHHAYGPDKDVSISEEDLRTLCEAANVAQYARGSIHGKLIHRLEESVRAWAYRSLVITKPVKAGDPITKDAIWSKRPGTGIPAKKMQEYIDRLAKLDIPANTMLTEDMLQ